jgi:glycyl-tRNA synthetase
MSQSSLQAIILKLQEFWVAHSCLIGQPYYTQIGAGTMNPSTFLRVLGPEPWNVAYVEPSIRPDDGRYGENPNRFEQHTQFQVILKPEPGNPIELYLQSLEAIGIDACQHDIRLVEDNWEQPAISAWGLGWEIWLDGQEITQFTYFQQVGGQNLDPVSVEITYGLERILIALNNAASIWDEPWGAGVTYGEIRRRDEFEQSTYYFEAADVGRLRQLYDLYRQEATACLARGLVVPAYDYVLKCSHTFNVLDTRGAIGVTERQAFFGQMRTLARKVAEIWLEQRKEMEYPLLKEGEAGHAVASQPVPRQASQVAAAQTFLLEIGVEEMPVSDVDAAIEQLKVNGPAWLDDLRLEHGAVHVYGTPRRLALIVEDLSPRQLDHSEVVKGPPASRAFTPDGKPTPAAIGFARSKGVRPEDLETRTIEGGSYVVVLVEQAGRPVLEVLSESLPGVVAALKFERSMRWLPGSGAGGNDAGVTFSRPIRWLAALFGGVLVPFEYAGLKAGRNTRGLRPYHSPEIEIPSSEQYIEILEKNGIVLDGKRRKALIQAGVMELAASVNGEALLSPGLLDEVANLVEKPTPFLGSFGEEFLSLPKEVLISVMEGHQRYFPVIQPAAPGAKDQGQGLLPYFVAVSNGDAQGIDLVRQGNEHVVLARFSDADFFAREDLKHRLEDFRPRLATLIFQQKLGSMLDKNDRVEKLVRALVLQLGLDADEAIFARRAAHLLKADLVSRMVIEMTSLQGIIGGEYARRNGEAPAVVEAIRQQYLPVPQTRPGLAVALADRLDSLAGLFAAGLLPSGNKDPFGLRRTAIGVVQPLIEHQVDFDLQVALEAAVALQPIPVTQEVQSQVLEFISGRLRVLLIEMGNKYDVVEAILAEQSANPVGALRAVRQLTGWVSRPDWSSILPAYARCVRITRDQQERYPVKPELLVETAEKKLFAALEWAEKQERAPGSVDDFLDAFLPMIPAVNEFFDKVLVMTENRFEKENRLGLLQRIASLADGAADLSKLEGF